MILFCSEETIYCRGKGSTGPSGIGPVLISMEGGKKGGY